MRNAKAILFFLSLVTLFQFTATAQSYLSPGASFLGVQYAERIGYHLHTAGDVNGDGFDDFLIGTFHNSSRGFNSGAAYLILGGESWQNNRVLTSADARFIGASEYDAVGYYLGGGGDINGDGYDDMLIGAPAGDENVFENPGHLYIVFGRARANWGFDFVLPYSADASFTGENQHDLAGISTAIVGDINGDGYDDFVCGAAFNDYGGTDAGKVYLFLGKSGGWARGVNLNQAHASFYGPAYNSQAGYSVDGVGDVNGDGIPDFAIGARGEGAVYLIFGRRDVGWGKNVRLSQADVIFYRYDYRDWSGWRVSGAGDVNGDGFDDILIGSPINTYCCNEAGMVYLIFGRSGGWNRNLAQADVAFIGEAKDDQAGWDVQGAGDVNGDGYADLVIGAWHNDSNGEDSGKLYLIKGKPYGWQQKTYLSTISDSFVGRNKGEYTGFSVAGAGDVNGDGWSDIVTSAPYNSQMYYWSGKIYLFLSENTTPPEPELSTNPSEIKFGFFTDQMGFTIKNSGGDNLIWEIPQNSVAPWIADITPRDGVLSHGAAQTVTIKVDRTGLSEGDYAATLSIVSNAGTRELNVSLSAANGSAYSKRVNCGSHEDYIDSLGFLWEKEVSFAENTWGYVGGQTYTISESVTNTIAPSIYQTERWGSPLSYRFEVPNGYYSIVLHFAEIYHRTPFARVFDVSIENELVLDDYDIFAEAGRMNAFSKTFAIHVIDGRLDIDMSASVDAATIAGIEIHALSTEPELAVATGVLDFGYAFNALNFSIKNAGWDTLHWKALGDFAAWIAAVQPDSGGLCGGDSVTVKVDIDRSLLAYGTYQDSILITSNAGSLFVKLAVKIDTSSAFVCRINCGASAEYIDSEGDIWAPDTAYVPGGFGYVGGYPYHVNDAIANSEDDPLYQFNRWGLNAYQFDVPNGNYEVTLLFSEVYFYGGWGRRFDVDIEGIRVLDDYDVGGEVGHDVAVNRTFEVNVSDQQLNVEFKQVIEFPQINAIQIMSKPMNSFAKGRVPGDLNAVNSAVPGACTLFQNYPNPFNSTTTIRFELPFEANVRLKIFNVKGEIVRDALENQMEAGSHSIAWDGRNTSGLQVVSGIYYYRLEIMPISADKPGTAALVRKMTYCR
ncbi:FG-GAP repeat protein [candidate division KSB1 bacterium]|nr:FG-GAP repeat protein [candidate division KSB1 bacterium]